jgi:hypothetical protein
MADESRSAQLLEHMDRWSRNQRLYETLKGMGLFVSPVPEEDDPTKIRYLIVSAGLPTAEPQSAAQPPRGRDAARPATRDDNVVDFPSAV